MTSAPPSTADDEPTSEVDTTAAGADGSVAPEQPRGWRARVTYMPGMDGLRGIGIVLMLLYHAEVSWVGDGALFTIEMFFVLSGYLITALFLVEHDKTERIDLKRFWVRRGRRLLPALWLIFLPIGLYALWAATAVEIEQMRGDGISTLFYVTNWWFIFSDSSYFAAYSVPSPFSHTWSLAIEEQFYLFIAVVVFLGFPEVATVAPPLAFITGGLVLASAAWMALLMRIGDLTAQGLWPFGIDPASLPRWAQVFFNFQGTGDPSRVYFGTDTRLQGLLTGVTMAFVLARVDLSRLSRRAVEIIGTVGVVGILAMFLLIQDRGVTWIYYGGFLLFDLIMVLVVIAVVSPTSPTVVRWLSWKPLVFLGLLSYSLYVWHLPIFVFLDQSRMPDWIRGWQFDAVRIAAAFLVALASYYLIEKPVRFQGLHTAKRRALAALVVVTCIGVFLYGTRPIETDFLSTDAQGLPTVLVAGDSMPFSLTAGVASTGVDRETGVHIYSASRMGCGLGRADSIIEGRPTKVNDACLTWPEDWSQKVDQLNPEATLLLAWGWELYDRRIVNPDGSVTELYVGTPEWFQWFEGEVQDAVDIFTRYGAPLYLMTLPCIDLTADTPRHPPEEAAQPHRVASINQALENVAARNADNVRILDLNPYLCPDGEHYQAVIDGVRMTEDGQHWSIDGADKLWYEWIAPVLQQDLALSPPDSVDQGG